MELIALSREASKWVFATQVVLMRQTYANYSELRPDHEIYNTKEKTLKKCLRSILPLSEIFTCLFL